MNEITIRRGQQVSIGQLAQQLATLGYEAEDYVYLPGQMALRGSLVDVFPFGANRPLRIDFFDDEVDSIRRFEVASQLSVDKVDEAVVGPRTDEAEEHEGHMALALRTLNEMQRGDFVVHVDHGVGRYGGLLRFEEGGRTVEKVKVLYRDDDAIYVSIHALHKLSKYRSRDQQPPTLAKLGGHEWDRLKQRTKQRIKLAAADLRQLYAQRQRTPGHAFEADGPLLGQLAEGFPYALTPCQANAWSDVRDDMERPTPMDRLVCGDVGFGKTEIAMRAAMKAAEGGKQVAILVPTTVLCIQHMQTFQRRFADLPVKVDFLCRIRSPKEARSALESLAQGTTDIIIGTHQLLGKSVRFRDLGLLVIDEEQKFGVRAKETLRRIRTNVDTLTLTATPLPRTLQFSLLGARDLSVLRTPPPGRMPVLTTHQTFSAEAIAEAVARELRRGGQTFVTAPHIEHLSHLEYTVRRTVPKARVLVAHGRLKAQELEQVVSDFAAHKADVLISTTIIENGVDIPRAGTIVIQHAEHFGLATLHQMRGRVGRSSRQAYCLLLTPPDEFLSREQETRLKAIERYAQLGSGLTLALEDLDLRGAGNLFGEEQSGFMAELGYETYEKIIHEAIRELRAEEKADGRSLGPGASQAECTVDTDLMLQLPTAYIPGEQERLTVYREIAAMRTEAEAKQLGERLTDRFGSMPDAVCELLLLPSIKEAAARLGAERIGLKADQLRLYFRPDLDQSFYQGPTFGGILAFVTSNLMRCKLSESQAQRTLTVSRVPSASEALRVLTQLRTTDVAPTEA